MNHRRAAYFAMAILLGSVPATHCQELKGFTITANVDPDSQYGQFVGTGTFTTGPDLRVGLSNLTASGNMAFTAEDLQASGSTIYTMGGKGQMVVNDTAAMQVYAITISNGFVPVFQVLPDGTPLVRGQRLEKLDTAEVREAMLEMVKVLRRDPPSEMLERLALCEKQNRIYAKALVDLDEILKRPPPPRKRSFTVLPFTGDMRCNRWYVPPGWSCVDTGSGLNLIDVTVPLGNGTPCTKCHEEGSGR